MLKTIALSSLHMEYPNAETLKMAIKHTGFDNVSIPLSVLRSLPDVIKKKAGDSEPEESIVLGFKGDGWEVISFSKGPFYGIALDLGTTNIAASISDLSTGERLEELVFDNPQIPYGEDILTRIMRADDDLKRLNSVLITGINGIIKDLCNSAGIRRDNIYAMAVSGNTAMSHFLLDLDPEGIAKYPHVPVVYRPDFLKARDIGININPEAYVYIFPNAGGYIGGDMVAGILCCEMYKDESISVFVDVGTNAEIAIGNKHWIVVGSGAAGPALEGGIVRHGKRASKGAINSVRIEDGNPVYSTIGGERPDGICGSALIDLMAELFREGIIDRKATFVSGDKNIVMTDDGPAYLIVRSEDTANRQDIFVTEKELKAILRSKGAMFTAIRILLAEMGMDFSHINKFYIAGTFGSYIKPKQAIAIGMLPDIAEEHYICLGNTSLKGAEMFLNRWETIDGINSIISKITFNDLSSDKNFMKELSGSLFLPHTDLSLFPSVC